MTYRNLKRLIIAMLVAVLSLSGCKNVKDIRVTSAKLETISFQGLKSLGVHLAVGIDNPARMQVTLEDINGAVKHSGKVIGRLAMDPFTLYARSAEIYHLRAVVSLAEGATLMDLALLMDQNSLNQCTVDISVRPRLKNGLSAPIALTDIPLKKLLDRATSK